MICGGNSFGILAFSLFLACAAVSSAQSQTATPAPGQVERLVVPEGAPLRVILTEKLRFKLNQPVHGRIVDPVFAFDREVLPAGADIGGHITGFQNASRWVRITSMLGGNFTPIREPKLTFDSLVLKDGRSIPIRTSVSPGADTVVRFNTAPDEEKKGKAATATDMARKEIESRKRAVIDAIKAPGKMDKVKDMLWSLAPWHPQYVPSGSRFNANLQAPLEFGEASVPASEFGALGSQPAPDAIVAARLIPSLSSKTATHGGAVSAVLTRPLFSSDNHLVFPEGSRLTGTVVQAQPARRWHRSGKLAFMFTRMQLPESLTDGSASASVQDVEGRLDGVEVNGHDGKVQLDEEGGAAGAPSKKRFIMPAIATMLAMNGAEGREAVRVHHVKTGAYHNNYAGRLISGGLGFGLLGSAMGRFLGPVGAAMGFYGAARSIYTNVVGPGQEVIFPADTPIEIRLSSGTSSQQ